VAAVALVLLLIAAARVAGIASRQSIPIASDPALQVVSLLYAHTQPGDTVMSDRVGEVYAAEREYLPNPLLRCGDDVRAWLAARRVAAFVFRDGYDPTLPRMLGCDSSRFRRLPAPAPYQVFIPQSRSSR
jgi:hypothetical protein